MQSAEKTNMFCLDPVRFAVSSLSTSFSLSLPPCLPVCLDLAPSFERPAPGPLSTTFKAPRPHTRQQAPRACMSVSVGYICVPNAPA